MEHICEVCGKKFESPYSNRSYCSRLCYQRTWMTQKRMKKMQTKICPICDKEFETPSLHKKYCSPRCQKVAAQDQSRKIQRMKYVRKTATCPVCGKRFVKSNEHRSICSDECKAKKKHPKTFSKYKHCIVCGKYFKPSATNQKCCSPECSDENNREMKKIRARTYKARAMSQKKRKAVYERQKKLGNMAAEAKDKNVSYGRYDAIRHSDHDEMMARFEAWKEREREKTEHQWKYQEVSCSS